MKALRFVLALAALLAACATFSPASLRDRCRPVLSVTIKVDGEDRAVSVGVGAGVIVMRNSAGALLLTANHVIAGTPLLTVIGADGKLGEAVVLRTDAERDLALIFAKGLTGSPARLAERQAEIGERLWVAGIHAFPTHGVYVVPGTVSTEPGPCISAAHGCFLARIESGPGSSGNPVFDQSGRLTGMLQGGTEHHPRLAWVIGLQNIIEFLAGSAAQSAAPPPA